MDENAPRTDGRRTPAKVLLVEDNPGDSRLIQKAFDEADVDIDLRIATGGIEGIEWLSRRRGEPDGLPAFVLLDLNLPRMTETEFLEAVRDDPELTHLPILVLPSSTDAEDVIRCYEKSANAFLTKPSSPDELIDLVDAICSFWLDRAKLPTTVA